MEKQQPTRTWRTALDRFGRDQSGAIAPIAAVVMIAALTGVTASIDISRLVTARTQLQDAVDSANLVLARMPATTTDADMKAKAQAWINANVTDPNIENLVVATPVRTPGQVVLNVTGNIKTTLASLVGVTTLPLEGHSTVKYGITRVELALVLDNTGSMNDDAKLASLKTAATTLVDTLNTSAAQSGVTDALKVGIVPFSMTVNVGSSYQTANWLRGDAPPEYGPTGDAVDDSHVNRFNLLKKMNIGWGGCVESRPQPYDVQETPPTPSDPASMFVPFFAPDEPDGGWYQYNGSTVYVYGSYAAGQSAGWANSPKYGGQTIRTYSENNYLSSDGVNDSFNNQSVGGVWIDHQTSKSKYNNATQNTGNHSYWGNAIGPNAGCTVQALQRLTTDITSVKNQISSMVAGGDTEIPLGLVWGWHVLSPNTPFADGSAYGTPGTIKVVVLVTDGANTYSGQLNNLNGSHYTAYGYAAQKRIGDGTAAGVQSALNDRLRTLCSNMKQKNTDGTWKINIYTVPLEVTDASTKSMLQGCVTDPANYLETSNSSQLAATFDNIAGSISKLRVSH